MKVWLALDPKDEQTNEPRVLMQNRPFTARDMPPTSQRRGIVWEAREADLPDETWVALLAGELSLDEQDRIHRDLWTQSGETSPWPT